MLQFEHVSLAYGSQQILHDLCFQIPDGQMTVLIGPSGCGKTTILRTIGGFIDLNEGDILINGKSIIALPPEKRPTAMVFQSYNLWPHMTVYDNMEFGLRLRKVPRAERRERIMQMLDLVKMPGTEKKYPGQMSGGQQQRIAIARSLLLRPEVLLLDEPFSALDAKIRQQMREELRKIQTDLNITVVFVTHDQEEAMALSDRVIVMNKGTIEQVGSPSEIYDRPTSRYVADFIGEMNFLKLQGGKTLAVRPENVHVRPGAGGELDGYVRTVMMLGHYVEMTMDTDYGIVKTFISDEESKAYHRGDPVAMTFARSHEYES